VLRAVETVTIPGRFNGPPGSANGGYACGVVAGALGSSARITLRKPPPLDVPLELRSERDTVRLLDGGETVAEGRVAEPAVNVPAPPTLDAAASAADRFVGAQAFPTCFVCGAERAHDGLGLRPGPLNGGGQVACPWTPGEDLASGCVIDSRFVWAALDCPSGYACIPEDSWTLLASMTATLEAPLLPDRVYIVSAWPLASVGRKHWAGAAIHEADGTRVAVAQSLWITVPGPR
jgi:hypothetical protein